MTTWIMVIGGLILWILQTGLSVWVLRKVVKEEIDKEMERRAK